MIFRCPGPSAGARVPIFAECNAVGVFAVLIKPGTPAPITGFFRDSKGQFAHVLYQVGQGKDMSFQRNSKANQGTFVEGQDDTFAVEFDGGVFSCSTPGALFLTGGDPASTVSVTLLHFTNEKPFRHWHRLTTLLANDGSMTIPDYHTRASGWITGAGVTIEGVTADLPPGLWSDVIPGTTLHNGRGGSLMVQTEWKG